MDREQKFEMDNVYNNDALAMLKRQSSLVDKLVY